MYLIPTRTELAHPFAIALAGLCATIAHFISTTRQHMPLLTGTWSYLNRTVSRLDRLVLLWQANRLPKPRASRPPSASPPPPRSPVPARPDSHRPDSHRPAYHRLPTGHLWLVRRVQRTVQYSAQIEGFLARPDLREFLAAAPQAGRLLRPLCRMLGITPPAHLALPPRPPAARKPRPPKPPRPKLPPLRPLPAYVRAAVRAWKPKYG